MKITKSHLKQIIQEELKTVLEADLDSDGSLNADELRNMADKLDAKDESTPEIPELKNIKIHSSGEHATLAVPGLRGRSKEDVKDYLMDFGIFPDKIGDGVVVFVRKERYLSSFRDFFEELQQYDERWSEHLDTGRSYDLDRDEPGEQYPLLEEISDSEARKRAYNAIIKQDPDYKKFFDSKGNPDKSFKIAHPTILFIRDRVHRDFEKKVQFEKNKAAKRDVGDPGRGRFFKSTEYMPDLSRVADMFTTSTRQPSIKRADDYVRRMKALRRQQTQREKYQENHMKITKPQLKQIILEELDAVLEEGLDEDLIEEILNDPREVVMCSEFLQKEEVDLEEKKKRKKRKGKMPKKFSVKSGDKSKSGGLTRKGVKRYRRANPGSKLKTAVTKKPSKLKKGGKAAKRRKSFCARMCGMKKKRTGAKGKRDPKSRINKALRKWNCNC